MTPVEYILNCNMRRPHIKYLLCCLIMLRPYFYSFPENYFSLIDWWFYMKRFFVKNKYKEIDNDFFDGELIFGVAIIIKEIQLHLIKNRNYQYIIQADLTNDVWNYADTRFVIKNKNDKSQDFLIIYQHTADIMSLHCLFQTHSKTELMYLKKQASVDLNISYWY